MGGSFDDTGGHNVLEPARLGCAIITGPSDRSIRADIDYLADHEAIIQVNSLTELATQLDRLLADPQQLADLGTNARKAMQQSTAVLDGYLLQIRDCLAAVTTN
jgi:3-deoxy-D-manno-octulosonic-acid transferase